MVQRCSCVALQGWCRVSVVLQGNGGGAVLMWWKCYCGVALQRSTLVALYCCCVEACHVVVQYCCVETCNNFTDAY